MKKIEIDYSKISDSKVVNIRMSDFPDFVDAYIESATYMDREMTDDELDILNQNSNYVYEKITSYLY